MKLNIKKIFATIYKPAILYAAISCSVMAGESRSANIYVPAAPSFIAIDLEEKSLAKYKEDIETYRKSGTAFLSGGKKSTYYGKITYKINKNKVTCGAKFKINGDYNDHIDFENKTASLNVSVEKNCDGAGYRQFKLLLPKSRNDENEVFWTVLLQYYDVLAPYTRRSYVSLDGLTYPVLFQEKINKDFVERNGIRDFPILEIDEEQLWIIRNLWARDADVNKLKKRNDVFAEFGFSLPSSKYNPSLVDSTYYKVDEKSYLENDTKIKVANIGIAGLSNPDRVILQNDFFEKVNGLYAKHALLWHNRKFLYNPYINSYIPIYYDGNVSFGESTCNDLSEVSGDIPLEIAEQFANRTFGNKITPEMFCAYKRVSFYSYMRSDDYKKIFLSQRDAYFVPSVRSLKSGIDGIRLPFSYYKNETMYLDVQNKNIQKLKFKDQVKALAGELYVEIDGYSLPVVNLGAVDATANNEVSIIDTPGEYNYTVTDGRTMYLYFENDAGRKLNLKSINNGRFVLSGSFNTGDIINLVGQSEPSIHGLRYNDKMLTGCSTFINARFMGLTVYSDVFGCEDSINIIDSIGLIDSIEIKNAYADALDFDSSKVNVSSVVVENAGNDCLDISYGVYHFNNATLTNCSDKGVSVGEHSRIVAEGVKVINSNIGVAVKDSSSAYINGADFSNVSDCSLIYSKKSRFIDGINAKIIGNCNGYKYIVN